MTQIYELVGRIQNKAIASRDWVPSIVAHRPNGCHICSTTSGIFSNPSPSLGKNPDIVYGIINTHHSANERHRLTTICLRQFARSRRGSSLEFVGSLPINPNYEQAYPLLAFVKRINGRTLAQQSDPRVSDEPFEIFGLCFRFRGPSGQCSQISIESMGYCEGCRQNHDAFAESSKGNPAPGSMSAIGDFSPTIGASSYSLPLSSGLE